MRTDELILYRDTEEESILSDMAFLMENVHDGLSDKETEGLKRRLFSCVEKLVRLSVNHGFEGNLWHDYLALYLAAHENE